MLNILHDETVPACPASLIVVIRLDVMIRITFVVMIVRRAGVLREGLDVLPDLTINP